MRRFALAIWLMIVPAFVLAQGTQVTFGAVRQDPNAPIEVTSQTLEVDQDSGAAVFAGDVVVVQGDMRLAAARVEVLYSDTDDTVTSVVATGGVTLVSQQDQAESDRANYDVAGGVLVMTGNALLTQGRNVISSEKMTIQVDRGTAQLSGRVRTVLRPKETPRK